MVVSNALALGKIQEHRAGGHCRLFRRSLRGVLPRRREHHVVVRHQGTHLCDTLSGGHPRQRHSLRFHVGAKSAFRLFFDTKVLSRRGDEGLCLCRFRLLPAVEEMATYLAISIRPLPAYSDVRSFSSSLRIRSNERPAQRSTGKL